MDAAAAEAARRVRAVRDDPAGRIALMISSYGQATTWSRAEVAFARWECDRGVLNPLDADPPGSAWWRTVNEHLLEDAEEARLRLEGDDGLLGSSPAVTRWMEFFTTPSPANWYRAHNSSVASGYVESARLALRENHEEQKLMNLTLMRVLYAQVMAEQAPLGLGMLAHIGRFLADPRSFGIAMVLRVPDFYPRAYPLDTIGVRTDDAFSALIDDDLVLPRLDEMYAFAAEALAFPPLDRLAHFGNPCYPWGLLVPPAKLAEIGFDHRRPSHAVGELRQLAEHQYEPPMIDLR
jgi:hypothetical protein